MELPINRNNPKIMHIDLNSCFATAEQQANSSLRGKPVVVAAYTSPNGCILSPSTEAKRYGIKTGMTVRDARLLCPKVIVRDPDPVMVRDIHIKFKRIFQEYSPKVTPKSIDEAIIDFHSVTYLKKNLQETAKEIKIRLRQEVGEWISCSIGIATNRFLAKLGASLHKPDGLDIITHENILDIYKNTKLTDLHGINTRYEARLNTAGIFTPLHFFRAEERFLRENVFRSIVGYYWHLRLKGWEIDDVEIKRKSFGQDYSIGKPTANEEELSRFIMKLCEKMGRRLRRSGQAAMGVHVACIYRDRTFWHRGKKMQQQLYTTADIFNKAQWIFNQRSEKKIISKISISCYDLVPAVSKQTGLFEETTDRKKNLSDTLDKINDRYGEFVITPALMMDMDKTILDRVAFGSVRELENIYSE